MYHVGVVRSAARRLGFLRGCKKKYLLRHLFIAIYGLVLHFHPGPGIIVSRLRSVNSSNRYVLVALNRFKRNKNHPQSLKIME